MILMQKYKKTVENVQHLQRISYFCIVMKIFTAAQIRELDNYTIKHEPVSSIDLMERAAMKVTQVITERWSSEVPVVVFAGPGNNGGDALAVSRQLLDRGYSVDTFLFNISGSLSADCAENKKRLLFKKNNRLTEVTREFDPPRLQQGVLVIDGLFGSGLNKPLAGGFASLAKYINASNAEVVSIDVPSGLMTEDNAYNVRAHIVKANLTLTFQQPKLAFLFPENGSYVGELQVLDIGLSQEGIDKTDASFTLLDKHNIRQLLRPRSPFAHKGEMGHALLICGSYGMAGAAVLATRACLRSGAGKVTIHTAKRNMPVLQVSVPEAVVHTDRDEIIFSEALPTDSFQALGIGSGLGTADQTGIAVITQLRRTQCPIVADADVINILSTHRTWMQQLPKGLILTPHVKEFERLEGQSVDSYERLTKARQLAERIQGYVILKGHYTAICMPDGHVAFNSTGNAGMATAGSGDVLTGIITGLLARGYTQADACRVGVYLHGLAGDLAAEELGEESLMASDIIRYLPKAFLKVKSE